MSKKIRKILAYVLSFAMIVVSFGGWGATGNVLADDLFDLGASENVLYVQAAFVDSNNSNSWTYTGSEITPEVELWVKGELVDSAAYTLTYYNNVDVSNKGAYVVITGNEDYGYTGSYTKYFTIKVASLSNAVITLESDTVAYAKYDDEDDFPVPNFTVSVDGVEVSSSYYTSLTSSNSATEKVLYVKGKGNYTGTSPSVTYTITDADISDQKIALSGYSFVYTGSEVKPTITITDSYSGNALEEDTDYTLSYSGDTTGSSTEDTTITVTITGKGYYTGTATAEYVIYYDTTNKKNMTLVSTKVNSSSYTYTGKAIENVLSKVTYGSTTLTEGTDYVAVYEDNVNVGTAKITLYGMGNYYGSTSCNFSIKAKSMSTDFVSVTYDTLTYNYGSTLSFLTANVTFYDDDLGTTLVSGTDYSSTTYYLDGNQTSPSAFTDAGEVTVKITGDGNYTGSCNLTLVIEPLDISDSASMTIPDGTITYNDEPVVFDSEDVTVTVNGITLTEGTDYELVYTNNKAAGTATVTAEFMGNYTGSVSKDFEIDGNFTDLSDATVTLDSSTYTYTGSEITPTVEVEYNGTTLTEGTEYSVSYSDNVDAGTGTVTIKGVNLGGYKGTITKEFTISPKDISGTDITVEDIEDWEYNFGAEITPEIEVYDSTAGANLIENEDYTVTYSNNTDVGTATVTITGTGNYTSSRETTFTIEAISIDDAVVTLDITEATYTGSAITTTLTSLTTASDVEISDLSSFELTYVDNVNVGTCTVSVTSTSNYCTGTASASFEITERSLANATATVSTAVYNYGYDVEFEVTDVYDDLGNELTLNEDYEIEISNSADVGDSTITLVAVSNSNYTGSCSFNTKIEALEVGSLAKIKFDDGDTYTWTGSAITPGIDVEVGNYVLDSDTDYDASYSNNIDCGTATVTVTFKGNFSGTASESFSITQADIMDCEAAYGQTYIYTGSEITPDITLTYGDYTLVSGTDYTVSYNNNTDETSDAEIIVTGMGNFTGSETYCFSITTTKTDIEDSEVTIAAIADQEYQGGSEIKPALTITNGGVALVEGTDYEASYSDNTGIGTATVTVTGIGAYEGEITVTFNIVAASLDGGEVILEEDTFEYTGSEIKPEVSSVATSSGYIVEDISSFTVSYSNNVNEGTGYVTITGDGTYYTGSATASFKIEVTEILVTSITLNKNSTLLTEGDSENLTATITPTDATNQSVSWESSDTSVVTVSNGTITAIGEGTAVITVAAQDGSGVTATCTVTVQAESSSGGSGSEGGTSEEDTGEVDSSEEDNTGSGNTSEENNTGSGNTSEEDNTGSDNTSEEDNTGSDNTSEEDNTGSGNTSEEDNTGSGNTTEEDTGSGNTTEEDTGSGATTTESTGSSTGATTTESAGSSTGTTTTGSTSSSTGTTTTESTGSGSTSTKTDTNASSVAVGSTYTVGKYTYTVTKASTGSDGTVTFTKTSGGQATVKIPATITIKGKTYKVTAIAKNAFKGDTKLKTLVIGSNVKTIGASAFAGCKNLKKVTIGKSVKKIGAKAFYSCKSLNKIIIKSKKLKTSKVGKKAFGKTKATIKVKVPKAKLKAYKKMLYKRGISKKAKIS